MCQMKFKTNFVVLFAEMVSLLFSKLGCLLENSNRINENFHKFLIDFGFQLLYYVTCLIILTVNK